MNIIDYLQHNLINLNLKARDKENAIRELAQLMKNSPAMSNFEGFLGDVFEREQLETTGIGDEIAIPHARTDAVRQLIIALGRSRHGIQFESPDGRRVKLLLLMGIPRESISHYLTVLAQFTRLLKRGPLREKLLEAQDNASVLELFKQMPAGE